MFYIGSEIIIISSNIKRKSGPRVGSIGTVIGVKKILNYKKDLHIQPLKVLFTRYGYEKNKRFEIKRIYVNTPDMFLNINNLNFNYKKFINKLSRQAIKNDFREPCVVASPINVFNNDVIKYLFVYLKNNSVRNELNIIAYARHKEYKNIIKNTPPLVREIIRRLLRDLDNKALMLRLHDLPESAILDLLKLIHLLTALYTRNENLNSKFMDHISSNSICKNLFMEVEYNNLKNNFKGLYNASFKFADTFKKVVIKQGQLVYKAHQE